MTSMTNDREKIGKLTKKIGNKKNTELGVGKIYLSKVEDGKGYEPYKGVENIFDTRSHNFHLVLNMDENEEIIEKYIKHICNIRKKIITTLENYGFNSIKAGEYRKEAPIKDYSKNTLYIYKRGGSRGNLVSLNKTKYSESKLNHLFRYIPCMKNGIYYNLNFMRFYIDKEAKVNVIYNAYQFDASKTEYTNQNYIGYPTRYKKHKLEELRNFTHNIYYNPQTNCLDFEKEYTSVEIGNHAEEIVKEFIDFIDKCEELTKKE